MVFMGKIIFTISFFCIAAAANCQEDKPLVLKGNELYKKQQYDQAADEYQKAAEINPKNAKALYNLGNALYKNRKMEEAQKVYDNAAENATGAKDKSRAVYNKGVALTREKKLPESIDAYKQTLRLNPADEEARQNLQKALNELKKQPPQPQPKQDKKKDKQKNQNNNDQQQNKSKLNQKQAEQMLSNLRQDEKKLQQDLQKKNNILPPNGKDW